MKDATDISGSSSAPSVEEVLLSVIDRRHGGEPLADADVVREHPDLMPVLAERLAELHEIESLCDAAADGTLPFEIPFLPRINVPGYTLRSVVSFGGQGIVLLAEQSQTGRKVAVKISKDGRLADRRQRERLQREAEMLSRLSHPNIVAYLDHGETSDGQFYLVTEFIEGESLEPTTFVTRHGIDSAMGLFLTVCHAVGAAHQLGIVHRDLKPSNIRIGSNGTPYVMDFGLARSPADRKISVSMTAPGQILGTFLWSSPEQLDGSLDVTPASDVYSLGVILHELVARGSFPPAVVAAMLRRLGPAAPQKRIEQYARALTTVDAPGLAPTIDRCLMEAPAARFKDANELAAAVSDYLIRPSQRSMPGRRWLLPLGILLVVLISTLLWSRRSPDVSTVSPNAPRLVNGRPILQFLSYYELVWIPPGEAVLGTPAGTAVSMPDERPHHVKFDQGFYILRSEVSQGLWTKVMRGENPDNAHGNEPVTDVSWHDAREFCRRLSELEGKTYRLPTEDEWEYAARAGQTGAYPNYITVRSGGAGAGDWPLLPRYANFADRSSGLPHADAQYDDGAAGVTDCFKYVGNGWELCDTLGNVWEWTAEPYRYDLSVHASAPATEETNFMVSTRGGSFYDTPHALRFGNRNPLPSTHRGGNVGFRVVSTDQ